MSVRNEDVRVLIQIIVSDNYLNKGDMHSNKNIVKGPCSRENIERGKILCVKILIYCV